MKPSKFVIPLLLLVSAAYAQTDSMFVEKSDGSMQRYAISAIKELTFNAVTDVKEIKAVENILRSFTFRQNYPNPFNPSTTIEFEIPKAGNVSIRIFDISGRLVRKLQNSQRLPGLHKVTWDGRNDNAQYVSSGGYLCQVEFNESFLVKKLMLVK